MAQPSTHRVRIIGGRFRGRVIRLPRAPGLRPTPDRVRETLFNWLGQDLTELATLDLYAGSGALSLEALSRGAAAAVAVERDPAAARAIARTGEAFGAAGLEVAVADVRTWLARDTRRFDVIFADPPFAEDPWPWLLPACDAHLAPGGFVYAEAPRALAPPPPLALHRHAKAGHVHYHLLRRGEAAAPPEPAAAPRPR
ncbi:MAG: 16S rRNA (guanine(966)-N(2))-methyltransferase RsmD [Betaproteobacteria bacterium]|nr:16S rRNA (guanine(966)-N(2))-methyltransferase RsmD [Betaproteobacteria bacterium]MCC7217905.1 16S rRNA (guanine(966)-N(2))-methyltransferase RsmD [Burkholderiales bacterium]